jgi:hypothetical protein
VGIPSPPPARKFKVTPSVRKFTVSVFWNHKDELLVDFIHHGNTVTAGRCCGTLARLREAIYRTRRGLFRQSLITMHDNARPHIANHTCWLQRYACEVMDLPAVPISRSKISIPFGPVISTWLTSDLHQPPTCSELSPPDYRHLTQLPFTLGYKPWCHSGTSA